MLVPIMWLKDHIDIDIDLKQFADKMTLSGTKVESVEIRSEGLKNIVTGKVIAITRHPDSDHMWICEMDLGDQIVTIVTGAQNVQLGDVVPVAKDGSIIDGGVGIKTSLLRGVKSEGMLCSAPELGISSNIAPKRSQDGIYILPSSTPIGEDICDILGLNDHVIDFELTNNRQDCNSILGIAYEAAATLGKRFEYPKYEYDPSGEEINEYLDIEVKNYDLCHRYTARMVRVVKIEPSPLWMQIRLMSSGVRPINNVVDVSNFVMLETGQPLHTFDYHKLAGGKIIVKTALDGEVLQTLDGVERKLNSNVLMIDDGENHVGIAGIMGGGNSDIDDNTKMVVIEAANFDQHSIRQSSKYFGLRTEASAHFEKGISMHLTRCAADRAASLLVEIGAAEYIDGIIDKYEKIDETIQLSVDAEWVSRFVGVQFTLDQVSALLDLLGFDPIIKNNEVHVTVPKFRQDILLKEDLAEEVARMYGYNKIPNTLMESSNFIAEPNRNFLNKRKIKNWMIGAGGYEMLTYSFISPSAIDNLDYDASDLRAQPEIVINPLGEDNSVMRTTLITGLLEALSLNYNHKHIPQLMFELSGVYLKNKKADNVLPEQFENLCFGKFNSDFYEIKSVAEYIFKNCKIDNIQYVRSCEPTLHPGRSADILYNDEKIGYLGQVHPKLAKKYQLEDDTVIAEIDTRPLIEKLIALNIKAKPLAKYPAVERDLALVCEQTIMAGEIKEIIIQYGGEYLVSCEPFDVYVNEETLGKGKKSIAFALSFRSDEKTLTDEEIDQTIEKLLASLKEKDIELRA